MTETQRRYVRKDFVRHLPSVFTESDFFFARAVIKDYPRDRRLALLVQAEVPGYLPFVEERNQWAEGYRVAWAMLHGKDIFSPGDPMTFTNDIT